MISGPPALLNCTPLRRYTGHRDGIWEVSVSRMRLPILGTASADHSAIIWGMHSGQALLQYTGHAGSVNSLRFHPNKVKLGKFVGERSETTLYYLSYHSVRYQNLRENCPKQF